MTTILTAIRSEHKLPYLLGDYNINLLNIEKHPPSQEFVDIMYERSLFPSITEPTRVTSTSATIIDNIFCTTVVTNPHIITGILCTDISDHFPVFHIDYTSSVSVTKPSLKKRTFSEENIKKFNDLITNHSWTSLAGIEDPQLAYTTFHKEFTHFYEVSFPVKTFKPGYKNRKPWLTDQLKRQSR